MEDVKQALCTKKSHAHGAARGTRVRWQWWVGGDEQGGNGVKGHISDQRADEPLLR